MFGFDHLGGGGGSSGSGGGASGDRDREDKGKKDEDGSKKLPIINPLVRLPNWPSKYK